MKLKIFFGKGKYGIAIAGNVSKIARTTPYISAASDVASDIGNGEKVSKIVADGTTDVAVYVASSVIADIAADAALVGAVGGPVGMLVGAAVGLGIGIFASVAIDGVVHKDRKGNVVTVKQDIENDLSDGIDYVSTGIASWF